MFVSPDLALFAHVARRPEDEIDLAQAALLLGALEDPQLDISAGLRALDDLAEKAQSRVERAVPRVVGLARYLFEEASFRGNREDYYDPRNSFLGDVLSRRLGIPITLSVLMMEVGRRVGVVVEGVNFPNHFLVRSPVGQGYLFFDPYERGQILNRQGLQALNKRITGQDAEPSHDLLQSAPKKQILTRMLHNLRGIYDRRQDVRARRFILERLALLNPYDETLAKELASLPIEKHGTSLMN